MGVVPEDRTDVGTVSVPFLRSALPGEGRTLLVDWAGTPTPPGSMTSNKATAGRPGAVAAESARLSEGDVSGVVRMRRTGLVVLSASFDPGWHVFVDGRPATTVMVAPALVAVSVGSGTHRVVFRYVGFSYYMPLVLLSVAVLVGGLVSDRLRSKRASSG